ncbi:DUF6551 family protein [Ancylobacter mangrovi]|uniref:DUF6551 family protein n=1 Tax=Ancylobacter mangrovi TaxID=2972472 RepID=UPI002161775E|nr:DUF6551 family protein [Ancylobacter mangrovi]MCS0501594.1 hypothetical protein [Ancylobacter mangrovi]
MTDETPRRRKIEPLALPGIEPGGAAAEVARPEFRWVRPGTLRVDENYQRNLSDRSISLIRRIVADWDWRRFKPPIVVEVEGALDVLDGQHTAIAAESHPQVTEIPVMVVRAESREERAQAFIGHNRDRIAVTPTQLHAAAVAAGDPEALTVDQVCARAGLRILRVSPGNGAFKPGDTMAVGAIGALIGRRGAMRARQMLEVLGKARMAPVSFAAIRATEMLLTDPEYAGEITPEDLSSVIMALGPEGERQAKLFAASHGIPLWRALGITWFKRRPRGRKRAG